MELPVYTNLLKLERRLYHVGQMTLPRPLSLTEALVGGGVIALAGLVAWALRLSGMTLLTWLGAGVALAYGASWLVLQPLADRKPFHGWLLAQIRYLLEPAVLIRLAAPTEPRRERIRAEVFGPVVESEPVAAPGPSPMDSLRGFRLEVMRPEPVVAQPAAPIALPAQVAAAYVIPRAPIDAYRVNRARLGLTFAASVLGVTAIVVVIALVYARMVAGGAA